MFGPITGVVEGLTTLGAGVRFLASVGPEMGLEILHSGVRSVTPLVLRKTLLSHYTTLFQ